MVTIRRRLLAFAGLALMLFVVAHPQIAQAQASLTNSGFETPYSNGVANGWNPWHEERNVDVNCDTESMYRRPTWSPEEVGGKGGELWFEGSRSQHIGNSFATWRGGVFQTVSVSPGTYTFSVNAWGRASQDQYPAPSDQSVDFYVRVGISPSGSGNWTSSDIVWGPLISPHGTWQSVSVEATTSGNNIGVFIDANFAGPGHCRKHLDVWLDAASLTSSTPAAPPTSTPAPFVPATATPNWNATQTVVASSWTPTPNWNATLTVEAAANRATATPTETAEPTNTPRPTSTPVTPTPNWNATATVRARNATPTPNWNATLTAEASAAVAQPTFPPVVIFQPTAIPVLPTNTPAPTEVVADSGDGSNPPTAAPPTDVPPPTSTPAPSGGTICVNTFADENANGLRDPLEGYMANVPLFIGRAGTMVNQGVSNGTETPLCFDGLEPGEYEIAQQLPGGLEMTTAGNLAIEVAEGQVIGLEFGSRVRQASLASDSGSSDVSGDTAVASAETSGSSTDGAQQVATATDDGGRNLDTMRTIGIVLAGLAVLLLGGVLFALLRN